MSGFDVHPEAVPLTMLDSGPYLAQGQAIRKYERLHAIMATWHYENHAGPYLRCHQQPCRDLNRES